MLNVSTNLTWHNDHIEFISAPFLKDGQRQSTMKHSRCWQHNHRARIMDVWSESKFQNYFDIGLGKSSLQNYVSQVVLFDLCHLIVCWCRTNTPVKTFDVLEVKHVSFNKRFSNLLISPSDEHLVIVICFLSQANTEVNRNT